MEKMAPLQIGRQGQLQEWLFDYPNANPSHRHTSHLISLYPSDQIRLDRDVKLARATRVTIESRQGTKNWEGTGWSFGNILGYWARLRQPDEFHINFSGTKIRKMIQNKERIPNDLMRPEISKIILEAENPFVE